MSEIGFLALHLSLISFGDVFSAFPELNLAWASSTRLEVGSSRRPSWCDSGPCHRALAGVRGGGSAGRWPGPRTPQFRHLRYSLCTGPEWAFFVIDCENWWIICSSTCCRCRPPGQPSTTPSGSARSVTSPPAAASTPPRSSSLSSNQVEWLLIVEDRISVWDFSFWSFVLDSWN